MNLQGSARLLVQALSTIRWSRDVEDWREQAQVLGLRAVSCRGQRVTYEGSKIGGFKLDEFSDSGKLLLVECTLAASNPGTDLSTPELDQVTDEYFAKFEDAVTGVRSVLGAPDFNDGRAAKGFPEDQEADWLALWHVIGARLMVQQKHEDRELPFRICLVIAPT